MDETSRPPKSTDIKPLSLAAPLIWPGDLQRGRALRQMLQCPRQTVHLYCVADIVGNLSATNFRKPRSVGFGCVADNVFNVFLVLYVSDTNNDVNPGLEKSRTFSFYDICHAHQIRKMLATVCHQLQCKCITSFATTLLLHETWESSSINPFLRACQVSTQTVHSEVHIRDVM